MKKMLIADDEPAVREVLGEFFQRNRSFAIVHAADGNEALTQIREFSPDLVLLDWMMPGEMDGLKVLTTIRSDPRLNDTRVLMISGDSDARGRDLCVRAGADGYLSKPFSISKLMEEVDILLGSG